MSTLRELLTKREIQVVKFVSEGWSNSSIAVKMNIQEDSADRYLAMIFNKLGISRKNLKLDNRNPTHNPRVLLARRFLYEEGFGLE